MSTRFAGSHVSSFMKGSPDYSQTLSSEIKGSAEEQLNSWLTEAQVAGAGASATSQAAQGKFMGEAAAQSAAAHASADSQNAMLDAGAGFLKTGLGQLGQSPGFSYNETPFGAGNGVVDGYGTLGPNYGIRQFG